MATYPVRLGRRSYRGANSKRHIAVIERNRTVSEIEDHINCQIEQMESGTHVFSCGNIANEMGIDVKLVREICYQIACGSNLFRVIKQ
jgi:hypothetical protein